MTEDEEILLAFLEESRENLDELDRDLVGLEARPDDPSLLARIFRAVHTLKGTCGFLGFPALEELAHAGEDLLGALRDGSLVLDQPLTTSLLRLLDRVRTVLAHIEQTSQEPVGDHAALIEELRAHLPADVVAGPTPEAEEVDRDAASGDDRVARVGPLTESSVRVDVAVLDKLMDLVGELVLARSRIGEFVALDEDGPLASTYRDLRVVSGELQDSVMTARMQPIGTVTGKFHRIARDLAAALGKQVSVRVEGEDVGVDKAVNEALRDPLLHLVRNALDHGIELPADRQAGGKPAAGELQIRAFHKGGRVHVEVADDGRGIDADALVAKAVEAGLVDDEAVLSIEDKLELMFLPGLSTRDEVTAMSGRGVGMDVVRTSLEQVGGSIDVTSTPGTGTVFRLNVPLTLAIMPVMVTWCGGGRYAVPQVNLREVVHLDATQVASQVEVVDDARLLRLRGRLLPLVDLAGRLEVPSRRDNGAATVVVVETDSRRLGLVVDEVGDIVDTVVKPLPRLIRSVQAFAGTTILGDGQPALILDIAGLAGSAGAEIDTDDGQDAAAVSASDLILATAADGGQLAVRIGQVRRLESFAADRVERTGDLEVVQYGEEILPLLRVADLLPERRSPERVATTHGATDTLSAVVCESSLGPVGLLVRSIEDVVPEPATPAQPPSRVGVEACLIVGDRVAELLDVEQLVVRAGIGRTP